MNIKRRVHNLVKKHGTTDPLIIAEHLGISILTFDLPPSIRGFLVRVLRRKIIILNSRLNEFAKKVVVCHEIGHARLHSGYGYHFDNNLTYYIPSKREQEANEYAAFLLSYSHDINADLLTMIIKKKKPDPKLIHKMLAGIINHDEILDWNN